MPSRKGYLTRHQLVKDNTTSVEDADTVEMFTDSNVSNVTVVDNGDKATIKFPEKYTDAEAEAAAPVQDVFGRTGSISAQSGDYSHDQLSNVLSDQHHTKYTNSEARNAVIGNVNVEDLVTNGASGQVAVSNGTGLDMANLDHTNLSNVLSDQHHTKYTDSEARNAVIGNVNVEDLVTASSTSGEVPTSDGNGNLTMQTPGSGSGSATGGRFFNSPFYAVSDGNYETVGWIHVPSNSSVDIQEVGVRNDLNNTPTGLNVVIYNVSTSTEELSRNLKYDSGSPLVTLSGEADFEVRVENNTGSTQSGTVFASAEGASSSGSNTVDVFNTNFSGTQTTEQTDAPALNFEGNLVADWDSANTEVDVDLNSHIKVDTIEARNNSVVDITGTGGGASQLESVDTILSETGPGFTATSTSAWTFAKSNGSSSVDLKNIRSLYGGAGGAGGVGKIVFNMGTKNFCFTNSDQRMYGSNLPIGWCLVNGGSSPTFEKSSPGVEGVSQVNTGVYRIDLNENSIPGGTLPAMPYGVSVEPQDTTGGAEDYSWLTHYDLDTANRDVLVQFVKLTFNSDNSFGAATKVDPLQFTVSFYGFI